MESTIERLKTERDQFEADWFETGKRDGKEWAERASYEDLRYAATQYRVSDAGDPKKDDYLGTEFEACMDLYEDLADYSVWKNWLWGWLEGVRTVWNELKAKTN